MDSSTALNILLISQKYGLYTSYIVLTTGIIGNFLNIFIFTNFKAFQNNQCVLYFVTESISNICQLITFFLIRLLTILNGIDPASSILFWCKFRPMMIASCTLISFSAICFSACDQYLSTNLQFNLRKLSTIKLAKILILIAIIISILHSIPFCIFLEIRASVCAVFNPKMSQYLSFFYYPILSGFLPIFIASLFSILAYRNVRRIVRRQIPIVRRRLDRQLTAMVLIRIIAFVILTLPYGIQRMYTYLAKIDQSNLFLYAINNLVGAVMSSLFNLNHAMCFYIFMASSSRFRRQVKYVLVKKCCQRLKRWFCCNKHQVYPNMQIQSMVSSIELE
ncbi:unnamed protein product [Rotaria sordida]|uniref:G-protein coupled receptors family 1 profile domain-containing protein n=1 Tax=Rotaria sordida TaxID=392033 RepID=A0A814MMT1_9BILA|nr:unnamed protein product [Rotaria sordida]CAF3740655.1 unnamed protein product [Rotaria sordida]